MKLNEEGKQQDEELKTENPKEEVNAEETTSKGIVEEKEAESEGKTPIEEAKTDEEVSLEDVPQKEIAQANNIEPIKAEEIEKQSEPIVEPLVEKSQSKKNKWIITSIIAVVVLIAVIFGAKAYMDDQAHKAYVKEYNDYLALVEKTAEDMFEGGLSSESLSNDTVSVWYNAIWKKDDVKTDKYTKLNGTFVSDFNSALSTFGYDTDTIKIQAKIEVNQDTVDASMSTLKKIPEGLEDHYDAISELYDVYTEFTGLALSPTGSLRTYQESITKLDSSFITKYNKVKKLDFTEIE